MNFQNIFRAVITSLIGAGIIILGVYFYFFAEEGLDLYTSLGVLCVGSVFLLMPDKIPAFVERLFNKVFGGGTPPPAA